MDASAVELANYIADLLQQLAPLAQAKRLDTLAYLLNLARMEAEQALQGGG